MFGEVQAAIRQHAAEQPFASSIRLSLANERHRAEGERSILFNARRLRSVLRSVLSGRSRTAVTSAAIGTATAVTLVATTMATTMAALTMAALTMATLTMAAFLVAAVIAAAAISSSTATIATMTTMAGSGLLLGAGQGIAHNGEKQRDSQKQSAIHPRILQNQRYLDVRDIQYAVAVVRSCRRRRHLPADRDFGLPLKRLDLRHVLPAVK